MQIVTQTISEMSNNSQTQNAIMLPLFKSDAID